MQWRRQRQWWRRWRRQRHGGAVLLLRRRRRRFRRVEEWRRRHPGHERRRGGGGAPKSAGSKVIYTDYAGPSCPTPQKGGYYEQNRFTDGDGGWYSLGGGGYVGHGCNGVFASVPMSGDPAKDAHSRVMWWWEPGTSAKSCQLSVYVPKGPNDRDVAGHPTTYHVLTDPFDRTTKYDSFTINQAGHRAQWVNAGSFAVKQGKIGIKLLDRGDDWSAGWNLAHHAAAQMKVTCRT
ncbi:adhesin [Streptomyces sp. FXJ1.4098]|nr:adhesin [Streptomyces sp. FXJ1.4098]